MEYSDVSAVYITKEPDDFHLKLAACKACIKADIDIPEKLLNYFISKGYTKDSLLFICPKIDKQSVEISNVLYANRFSLPGEESIYHNCIDIFDIPLGDVPKNAISIRVYVNALPCD